MPRCFFDAFIDSEVVRDASGDDLADATEVRDLAVALLLEIAGERIGDVDRCEVAISTRDEQGRPVYKASLSYEGTRGVEP